MKIINRSLKYLLLSLLAFFLLSPLHVIAEEGESVELNYVALGDSLAAGFLNKTDPPLYEIGNGYPFFIKQGIEAEMGYEIGRASCRERAWRRGMEVLLKEGR